MSSAPSGSTPRLYAGLRADADRIDHGVEQRVIRGREPHLREVHVHPDTVVNQERMAVELRPLSLGLSRGRLHHGLELQEGRLTAFGAADIDLAVPGTPRSLQLLVLAAEPLAVVDGRPARYGRLELRARDHPGLTI